MELPLVAILDPGRAARSHLGKVKSTGMPSRR
jgi:hypothetical protein